MKREMIKDIICALFVFLFVYTAITKFAEYDSFNVTLQQSPLVAGQSAVIAWLLPTIELTIAGLLLIPATKKTGLAASLVIMVVFTGYICYMILFTPKLPCSCGGVIKYMSWKVHLVFNLVWILLALTGLKYCAQQGVS